MSSIKEIEHAVSKLTAEDLVKFRAWYEEFDAEIWDKEFEEDVKFGKLDVISEKAIEDFNNGKYKEI